jgi:hypothetical protein
MMRTNAPVAVSDDLQQYVRFSSGRKDSSLRMEACVPLYQITGNSYASSTLAKGGLKDNGTGNWPYIRLSSVGGISGISADTERPYISPIFELIATAFVRYKIEKLTFVYEPQSATTVQDRLVFSYANDPSHPLITNVSTASANQENLLALSDSVAFAPWRSWSLDVSSEVKQDLLYTYNQSTTSVTDNRFTMFGSIGCVASVEPTTDTTAPVYGILYAKIVFEFIEFCPLITGFTPTMFKRIKAKGFRARCCHEDCKSCTKPCKAESTIAENNCQDLRKPGNYKTNYC